MSSKHFKIFLEANQVFIEDNSSNGTYVDGRKLTKGIKEPLKNGDLVTFFSAKPEGESKDPHPFSYRNLCPS